MAWTREEIQESFDRFAKTAEHGGATGDWVPWSECFTEDAEYYEHHYGKFSGRAAILAWITETMAQFPNNEMTEFPAEWVMIDEERGWLLCAIWNRFKSIGDGEVYQEINWTMLHYAGNGLFSYEEDIYNPNEFGVMVGAYLKARKAAGIN
ncbi:unannotated protein [freshwater metagenome]|uniref:Unannotated protein n=1 Tax=freshwater metagenome TaxID=449393 RepID=A0A6J6YGN4_9ZZZZ|nr:nuclear transport factor 2 family protein [Actinomycetota bacterium]